MQLVLGSARVPRAVAGVPPDNVHTPRGTLGKQTGGIGIRPGNLFHRRPLLRLFLQTRHEDDGDIARNLEPQLDGRRRSQFPDFFVDLGRLAVKRIFSRAGVIAHHTKGEDIVLETVCEVALPFLR